MNGLALMIDLETLDTRPTSIIVSAGAVLFNKDEILVTKEWILDLDEQELLGRTISVSTFRWWLNQTPQAQSQISSPNRTTLFKFTDEFVNLFKAHEIQEVWSNGSDFDLPIIADLYKSLFVGAPRPPWNYHQTRCFRTLNALTGCKDHVKFEGERHTALADALYQARCVQWAMNP